MLRLGHDEMHAPPANWQYDTALHCDDVVYVEHSRPQLACPVSQPHAASKLHAVSLVYWLQPCSGRHGPLPLQLQPAAWQPTDVAMAEHCTEQPPVAVTMHPVSDAHADCESALHFSEQLLPYTTQSLRALHAVVLIWLQGSTHAPVLSR